MFAEISSTCFASDMHYKSSRKERDEYVIKNCVTRNSGRNICYFRFAAVALYCSKDGQSDVSNLKVICRVCCFSPLFYFIYFINCP